MKLETTQTQQTVTAKIVRREPRINIVHHVSPGDVLWGTRGRKILRMSETEPLRVVAEFPACYPRDFLGWPRLAQRAARADKCNVFVNSAGRVLGIRAGSVYRVEEGRLTHLGHIQGDSVLHRGICEGHDGWLYFGEYFLNLDRAPVRVWRVNPALSAIEVAYEFPAGSIRHVHGVYHDPFDPQSIWVAVGDTGVESCILQTRDGFRTVQRYGNETEIWRAVALYFTESHVCWLTDCPYEQNHACRMDRKTGALEVGQEIDCPVWYGTTTVEGISIGLTTVEVGPAVKRDYSSVLVSENAFTWREVMTFKKDIYKPRKLFKHGVPLVPSGEMSISGVWLGGEGLVGLDGTTVQVAICKEGSERL